jgi:O-glycosyl hydrolase
MNKKKIALFITFIVALTFVFVLSTCDMGYVAAKDVTNAQAPVIDTQPQSVGVDLNGTATLTVTASLPELPEDVTADTRTLKYQWYQFLTYRAYEDQAGIKIDNATNASFDAPTDKDGEFNYYVVVSNEDSAATGLKMASIKSAPVTVSVNNPDNARYPVITGQPLYTGDPLTWSPRIVLPALEVVAEVTPASLSDEIRYQWFVASTLTNTQGTAIPGATAPRLVPPILIPGQEAQEGLIDGPGSYYYFVVVTNFYFKAIGRRESSVASSPVLLSIGANPNADTPVITKNPLNAIYFSGDTVSALTVEANAPEDGGVLSYKWYYKKASSAGDYAEVEGAASATLPLSISTTTKEGHLYYAVVTNTNDYAQNKTATATSRVAEINVTTPTNKPTNATFTVQFGGANQHQYVRGFGGMDVTWGNFPNYSVEDYENMFNPEKLGYNMVRIMILPTYTDINRTLDELIRNQIYTTMDRSRFYENVKTVNRYGGYVLASPWSPPAAWKTNNSINGGGDLRKSDYQNFANYLRAFAQNMLNNGAPIYAISISNEPNYTAGYDGCEWTGDQMRDFYVQVGHFTDGVAGFGGGKVIPSVRTMNGESANTTTINRPAMGNTTAIAAIDLLARHNYGSRNDNGAGTGSVATDNWIYRTTANGAYAKEIWMTEHNLNSNSGTTYINDSKWSYVWLFLNDVDMTVRINHEAAFIWWSSKRFYSMIGDGTYNTVGPVDQSMVVTGEILPRGWALAHYSKFAKESYRVGVDYDGTTANGTALQEGVTINGSHYADFTSQTVKVSAFMKLKGGEIYPVNWRNKTVPIGDVEEITMVMFTPTEANASGSGGYDMGTVKLQLPSGFKISSATAMRSDRTIFDAGGTDRGTPVWETVEITADRNAAYVELPRSTILSVRFTQ